ncbi:MAG: TonB-dependent receptor [Bacteroidota bacterium]|nr:TonB-dependent receptor [Bacteroidota bacterium]
MKKSTFLLAMLSLSAGSGTAFAETLDTTRIYPIDEVVINATRMGSKLKDIPQKIEVITSDEIESLPNENLAEVLKRLTNLDIIQYPGISTTVAMRGFSPGQQDRSYTLVLVNGKPAGTSNLAAIIPSNIERIEVIKGPYATLYGSDAMGGVLNIITKSLSTKFQGSINAEGGSFGFRRLDGSLSGSLLPSLRGGLSFSTTKQEDDYLIGKHNLLSMPSYGKQLLDPKSYGDTMRHSKYDLSQVNARLEWDINNHWDAHIESTYSFGNDIEVPGTYWGTYGDSKKKLRRINANGTIERKSTNGWFQFSPYVTREIEPDYSDNTSAGFINFKSQVSRYGFQLQQQQTFGEFKVVGGADFGVYDYHSERFETAGTPTSPYKPDNDFSDGALFAQVSYHHDRLDVNAGARYDHFDYHVEKNEALHSVASDNAYNTVNPSIGAQYWLLNSLKAHASFGTAFSVPDAYKTAGSYAVSIYYPDWNYTWTQSYKGNKNLKPEASRTTDLGLSLVTPNHALHADVTCFLTHHDDMIVNQVLTDGTMTYVNANNARMDGFEWSADYDLGSLFGQQFSLCLYTNWTYLFNTRLTQTAIASTGKDSLYTRDLQYVRKLNGNFGLSFRKEGLSARLNGRYIGSRFENDTFQGIRSGITASDYTTEGGYLASDKVLKYPDYLMFDLSARYAFKYGMYVGMTVANLLDENYTEKDGYNMPGRQIKFAVGYKF